MLLRRAVGPEGVGRKIVDRTVSAYAARMSQLRKSSQTARQFKTVHSGTLPRAPTASPCLDTTRRVSGLRSKARGFGFDILGA